jgi:hypothetical protein
MKQAISSKLNLPDAAQPNNSLNRSANRVAFIVNLAFSAVSPRPVNSGVMWLRILKVMRRAYVEMS